ncbi:MAG: hypothetical protein ABI970_05070 [Chloroflexota bacterium]|nr:hypothetical protein [Anaerolineae bacterium]
MATEVVSHSNFNVLNLNEPEMYSGRIESYAVDRQQLTLKFFSQKDEFSAAFIIHLTMVQYLDLPASWQGANIHTASEESCWDLLRQVLGPAVAKPDVMIKNGLLEDFRLFTIYVRQTNYRILAAKTIELVAP